MQLDTNCPVRRNLCFRGLQFNALISSEPRMVYVHAPTWFQVEEATPAGEVDPPAEGWNLATPPVGDADQAPPIDPLCPLSSIDSFQTFRC